MTAVAPRLDSSVLGPEVAVVAEDDPFRRELRRWLEENSPAEPEPLDLDERVAFRRAWQRTLFDSGWAGPAWPEAYGGRGAGPREQFIYYEELALARAPEPANAPGVILLGPTLLVHGNDELRARFLPGILSGEELWCQGFSEPNSGSDLASLRTRAERDGDDWVIHGQKIWTTWVTYADYCFVLCRTEPGTSRHRGLTLLICPLSQDGVRVRPIRQMSGDAEFGETFFDAARAPLAGTVGVPGEGWTAAMTMFQFERADPGFTDHARLLVRLADVRRELASATADGTLTTASRAQARETFAALWTRCQQLRRMNLSGAMNAERGESIGLAGSVTNLFWGDLEKDVADFEAAVRGASGLVADRDWSHHLLASRAASIYSGTSEIQRNIIAERILGLPR
jgi:alkylation response protein AidB-like acyl-CoA dehydrogenase